MRRLSAMMVSAGFAASELGNTELSQIHRFGMSWLRPKPVDHGPVRIVAHAAGADGVRGALHGPDIRGADRLPDRRHVLDGVGVDGAFVGAVLELDARLGHAERVHLVRQAQGVAVLRQAFAVDPQPGHVVVAGDRVHQRLPPQAAGARHAVGPGHRHHAQALHQVAGGERRVRRAHRILRDQGRGVALVAPHLRLERAPDLRRHVRHVVAADLAAAVRQAEVQQQARRFHRTGAQEHRPAALPVVHAVMPVDDRGHAAGRVPLDTMDGAARADLRAGRHRLRQVGHVHAGLGADAAALMAVAAIQAGMAQGAVRLLHRPGQHGRRGVAMADA